MELHQIRYAVALETARNFTRAAANCNVGQPALTRAIQLLESEFGGQLFHRGRAMTTLTDLGDAVLPHFREVEVRLSQARADAAALIGLRSGRLRVGVTDCVDPDLVAPLFADFAASHPDIAIVVRTFDDVALSDALVRGEVSFGLECGAHEDARFAAHPLYEEAVVLASASAPDGDRLVARANDELNGHYALMTVDRERWAEATAASGIATALMPESVARRRGLMTRPGRGAVRTTRVLTVRGRQHAPAVAQFLKIAAKKRRLETNPS